MDTRMKVLTAAQVRQADATTIAEGISSLDLMEKAARAFTAWFSQKFPPAGKKILVVCGPGNNGGDGLAIARLLLASQAKVQVWMAGDETRASPDFAANRQRLPAGIPVTTIAADSDLNLVLLPTDLDFVIDGLFGTGLSRPVTGILAQVIQRINDSPATVVAVDMPSGLFADTATPESAAVVRAHYTVSFQVPKLAFLLPQNEVFTGEWHVLPIGLSPAFLAKVENDKEMLTAAFVATLLKPRTRFSHKGTYGHALLLAGSHGKMGAAVLAARATLRSGVGLLSVHCPRLGYDILQISAPEAMALPDEAADHLSQLPDLHSYQVIGAGPGLGQAPATRALIRQLLLETTVPLVLDADALNIMAEENLFDLLPAATILTPHPKEFERLAGPARDDFHRLELLQAFCRNYQCYVVLKGGYTAIGTPGGQIWFNTTGNPGMATGGSGDVLTGILTALVAQQYPPLAACQLGVYVHGLAGDLAKAEKGEMALIASDLVEKLGHAFLTLQ